MSKCKAIIYTEFKKTKELKERWDQHLHGRRKNNSNNKTNQNTNTLNTLNTINTTGDNENPIITLNSSNGILDLDSRIQAGTMKNSKLNIFKSNSSNNNFTMTPEKHFNTVNIALNTINSVNTLNNNHNSDQKDQKDLKEIKPRTSGINKSDVELSMKNLRMTNNNNQNLNNYNNTDDNTISPNKSYRSTLKSTTSLNRNLIIPNENEFQRIKTFKIFYIPKWELKNGIEIPNISNALLSNLEYQSNIISDAIKVLLENIQNFKLKYLSSRDLVQIFKNLDMATQIKYNKIYEETCGLMMTISNMILLDFNQYLDKFVSIQPPRSNKLSTKFVKAEDFSFISNVRLFGEISVFLKGCFEVYCILIKQVDDMVLKKMEFNQLMQFISRSRMNVSNLIYSTKNYQMNFYRDEQVIIIHNNFRCCLDLKI